MIIRTKVISRHPGLWLNCCHYLCHISAIDSANFFLSEAETVFKIVLFYSVQSVVCVSCFSFFLLEPVVSVFSH